MAKEGERGSGAYTVIARDDGTRQWAHNGKPLYFYTADAKAGDARGEGQGGAWSVVKAPAAHAATMPARSNDGGY
jgi:predicted lipoprotein with Yx(FWY)xxD motif